MLVAGKFPFTLWVAIIEACDWPRQFVMKRVGPNREKQRPCIRFRIRNPAIITTGVPRACVTGALVKYIGTRVRQERIVMAGSRTAKRSFMQ